MGNTTNPDINAKEQKFLDALEKMFLKNDGVISEIEQKVFDAMKAQLSGKEESSLEDIIKAGKQVFSDKYAQDMIKLAEAARIAYGNYYHTGDNKYFAEYNSITSEQAKLDKEFEADKKEVTPFKQLKLAEAAGLQSAISKAEKRFLDQLRKRQLKEGPAFEDSNAELYEALKEELSKSGESTVEEVSAIVQKFLSSEQRNADEAQKAARDILTEMGMAQEASHSEITVPNVEKLAEKSGLKHSGRG